MALTKKKPLRSRAAKADGAVDKLARNIEKQLKVPKGSLKFVLPSGRKVRGTATVDSLRKSWKK
jgi:hypothetical protein